MSAKILEGGPIDDQISADLEQQIADLGGAPPRLVALMVGDNAGARAYAKMQAKACGEVGIEYELRELGEETTQEELRAAIEAANADDSVNGIILQMPVPEQIEGQQMQAAIAPAKDVDGVHPTNLGYLAEGNPRLTPCTAEAAVRLVEESGVEVSGAEVVVVGRSVIVGKPTALMLLDRGATVTICRSTTRDLPFHTSRADILVAAVGRAELIKGDEVKPGALVVDVGMNRVKDPDTGKSKYVRDVAFEEAKEVAGIITPVPGGVGPLTVTMLLKNTVEATRLQRA